MSRWILDTDHVSLALKGHPLITARIRQQDKERVQLYGQFLQVLTFLQGIRILGFDEEAERQYQQLLLNPSLRKNRLRQDMKIAAIALSLNATLVTRNYRDFSQVPGLLIEDWSL